MHVLSALEKQRIQLVEKYDRAIVLARGVKQRGDISLGLAHPFGHDVRTLDGIERRFRFVRGGACEHGFSRPRRTVQQHSAARLFAERGVHVAVFHGIYYLDAQRVFRVVQSYNVVERRIGNFGRAKLIAASVVIDALPAAALLRLDGIGLRQAVGNGDYALGSVHARGFELVAGHFWQARS